MRYAWSYSYQAHTVTGSKVIVPDEVADDQRHWDETQHTFPARALDGRMVRAQLRGDLYDLWGTGTGDMTVAIV